MITIFTENSTKHPVLSFIKRCLRMFKKFIQRKSFSLKYGGHYAVTRSLLVGLDELHINYNYNPKKIDDINKTVLILSNIGALETAIKLKQKGKIEKLFAGPNIINNPGNEKDLLSSKEIDGFIVNCEWTKELYSIAVPELNNKLYIWPAGVDEKYWSPIFIKKEKIALIYKKNDTNNFYLSVKRILKENGWQTLTIKYGDYKEKEFKDKLLESLISVFLSKGESQGLALVESWSMDVPTLVWNPEIIEPKYKIRTSSCPFLNQENGLQWKELNDLDNILKDDNVYLNIKPREWVMNNMTDKICAQKLIDIIKQNVK